MNKVYIEIATDGAAFRNGDGTLDVEIFSTPDAFWSLPLGEAVQLAYESAAALVEQPW